MKIVLDIDLLVMNEIGVLIDGREMYEGEDVTH